ncbi:MAG TPA: DUF2497 domain-containing protein, partial [Alphaproteobacteria bacterium]|nr:DUF2497 domain-containing protein [Alphaproteobacteria bacterium]
MSNESSQQPEPTMEEILASIRRIISDGDEPEGEAAKETKAENDDVKDEGEEAEAKAEEEPDEKGDGGDGDDEVLDLIDMVEEPSEAEAEAEPESGDEEAEEETETAADAGADDDLVLEDTAEELPGEELEEEEDVAMATSEETGQPEPSKGEGDEDLVSAATAAASTAHFAELAKAVDREPEVKTNISLGPGTTLEDLVKDMIRPMLKDWLDQNLPPLVDHLVRRE